MTVSYCIIYSARASSFLSVHFGKSCVYILIKCQQEIVKSKALQTIVCIQERTLEIDQKTCQFQYENVELIEEIITRNCKCVTELFEINTQLTVDFSYQKSKYM